MSSLVRQQVLAGRSFSDIEAANVYALQWCRHEISQKICRRTGQAPFGAVYGPRETLPFASTP